jgi:micrococcal nuclease
VSKVVKPSPERKRSPVSKTGWRKLDRDLVSVVVVGLGIALGLAWMGIDTTSARQAINDAATKVHELALGASVTTDPLAVSSIGDRSRTSQGRSGRYPVCSGGAKRDNCVIDGDTFVMNGVTIRISDIDAPETHPPRCAREADLGDRATTRLSQLLSSGNFQLVRENRDVDRYGRQLRVVVRNGLSLGRKMVAEGLARPWTGKRRPWCGEPGSPAG